jgi:energy-coupling factor transport system permease protein
LIHPAIHLVFFAAALALTMAAMQPVLLAISFLAALSLSFYLRGWRTTGKTLLWQLPLVALCALINPLFSMVGSTELFRIGQHAVYLESVAFGACMGLMLAAVMLWFFNASHVLTTDKVLAVLGNILPVVGLMISMAMRLVPQFVRRGKLIGSAANAVAAARPRGKREQVGARLRIVSVLMGWSMEDSLETADAMKARGWGAAKKRSSYRRYRFGSFDVGAGVTLTILVLLSGLLAWVACSQYRFYPTMSTLTLWWGYIPYALLMVAPLLLAATCELRWRKMP